MSIRVMSLVWDNFNEGGSPKLVMLAMADWCNDAGNSLHPSMHAIGKKVCVSEKQARRIVHNLIERGYLTVVSNKNGGAPGKTCRYQMNLEKLTTPLDVTPPTQGTPPLPPVSLSPPIEGHHPSHERESIHHKSPSTTKLTTKLTTNTNERAMLAAMGVSSSIAEDWIVLRKTKRAAITQTCLDGIQREAVQAGLSLDDALRRCCERGWTGFEARWIADGDSPKFTAKQNLVVSDLLNPYGGQNGQVKSIN